MVSYHGTDHRNISACAKGYQFIVLLLMKVIYRIHIVFLNHSGHENLMNPTFFRVCKLGRLCGH